jgi:hypothetical protein
LIVWRLRSLLMYIRYWFRRKKQLKSKEILS